MYFIVRICLQDAFHCPYLKAMMYLKDFLICEGNILNAYELILKEFYQFQIEFLLYTFT